MQDIQTQAKLVALVSTKGSVGKTTSIIQLSGYLANQGYKCLLIDADGQQTLSKFYNYDTDVDLSDGLKGFRELFYNEDVVETVHKTSIPNIDIIPNTDPDNTILVQLTRMPSSQYKLAGLINQLKPHYDFIFIDTEGKYDGAVSNVQNMVLMSKPDIILSLTQPKIIFANEVDRTIQLYDDNLKDLHNIGSDHVPELVFFINSFDPTLNIAKTVLEALFKDFEDFPQARLLKTVVPFKKAFFDQYYLDKLFMHEYKDNGADPLFHTSAVIKNLAEEIFPEIKQEAKSCV